MGLTLNCSLGRSRRSNPSKLQFQRDAPITLLYFTGVVRMVRRPDRHTGCCRSCTGRGSSSLVSSRSLPRSHRRRHPSCRRRREAAPEARRRQGAGQRCQCCHARGCGRGRGRSRPFCRLQARQPPAPPGAAGAGRRAGRRVVHEGSHQDACAGEAGLGWRGVEGGMEGWLC